MTKIVAKVLAYNPSGNALVLQRSGTHPRFAGHLDLPGGEVEAGEQAAAAVARELYEETGITISPTALRLAFQKPHGTSTVHMLYTCTLDKTPPVTLSWEHAQYYWLAPNELRGQQLPPDTDAYFKDVVDYLTKS